MLVKLLEMNLQKKIRAKKKLKRNNKESCNGTILDGPCPL